MKDNEARALTLRQLNEGCGAGWIETRLAPEDGDDSEGDVFELAPCAWCCGNLIMDDGSSATRSMLQDLYGKKYGLRLWTDRPTEEQREATLWDD